MLFTALPPDITFKQIEISLFLDALLHITKEM